MLKVRYYRLRLPNYSITQLREGAVTSQVGDFGEGKTEIVGRQDDQLYLRHTTVRTILTHQLDMNGDIVVAPVQSTAQWKARIFGLFEKTFFALLEPSRGNLVARRIMDSIAGNEGYFLEPLTISENLIQEHLKNFPGASMVSAKVTDFEIADGVVGRLEVSSRSGLSATIAPFLQGKRHRITSQTYDVTHQLASGLITYLHDGTLRASLSLAPFAFPAFERLLTEMPLHD